MKKKQKLPGKSGVAVRYSIIVLFIIAASWVILAMASVLIFPDHVPHLIVNLATIAVLTAWWFVYRKQVKRINNYRQFDKHDEALTTYLKWKKTGIRGIIILWCLAIYLALTIPAMIPYRSRSKLLDETRNIQSDLILNQKIFHDRNKIYSDTVQGLIQPDPLSRIEVTITHADENCWQAMFISKKTKFVIREYNSCD